MTQKFIRKNIELSQEFDSYIVRHPTAYKKIPNGSYVVLTIKGDDEFNKISRSLLKGKRTRRKIIEAQKTGNRWSLAPAA